MDRRGWTGVGEGTTCMVRCPVPDDDAFARRLLEKEGVLVAPGSLIEMPGWIRLGLLADPEAMEHALQALTVAVKTP
jgi:aspartate/methionine/tyrosine aminotransferase